MKKLFLMAAVIVMGAVNVNAQYKPEKMSVATELNYSGSNVSLPEFGARARLFLNENMVVRLGLGFATSSTKTTNYVLIPDKESYTTNSSTTFSLAPGFEYHFSKFDRVSPYVGAELGFLFGSTKDNTDNNDNSYYKKVKSPIFGFKIGAVTGVDVHIYKGFYIGAELGLGYTLTSEGRGETKEYINDKEVITKGDEEKATNSFGLYATPALRVGWFF